MTLTVVIAGALATATPPLCNPLPSATSVIEIRNATYILVGETHGTDQQPEAFAQLICALSGDGMPIVVALEQTITRQAAINAYLRSNGSDQDRIKFTRTAGWASVVADGRTSAAMLRTLETLRSMYRQRLIRGVVAIDVDSKVKGGDRELALANNMRSARNTGSRVVALLGSLHARKGSIPGISGSYMSAAGRLPARETISLLIRTQGGGAWNCSPACGVNRLRDAGVIAGGLHLTNQPSNAFDGFIDVAAPATPSSPATTD